MLRSNILMNYDIHLSTLFSVISPRANHFPFIAWCHSCWVLIMFQQFNMQCYPDGIEEKGSFPLLCLPEGCCMCHGSGLGWVVSCDLCSADADISTGITAMSSVLSDLLTNRVIVRSVIGFTAQILYSLSDKPHSLRNCRNGRASYSVLCLFTACGAATWRFYSYFIMKCCICFVIY